MVKTVRVAGISRCSKLSDDACCLLSDHNLAIRLYTLHSNRDDDSSAVEDDDAAGGRLYSLTRLPHEDLDGKWESLVFDEPIGETTLRALSQAMINGRRSALHTALGNWQHTVLLHGPCGTGKTTLAQALAQKLCIRLSSIFDNATLLHVNAHSLFTRFFGESAKNVGRLFNDILELSSQEDRLLIVIFDEVETLASCRQTSLQGNEVADSMRVSFTTCSSSCITIDAFAGGTVHKRAANWARPDAWMLQCRFHLHYQSPFTTRCGFCGSLSYQKALH